MFDMVKIGRNIAKMRKEKGMTQMEMADKMGVSYQAVSNWERGETMPDISKLPELAEIFEVSIDHILENQKGSSIVHTFVHHNTSEFLKNNEVTVEDFSAIAPILKAEHADEVFEHIKTKFKIQDMIALAPFVSTELIDECARTAFVGEGIESLKHLAPFMSDEAIEECAKKAFEAGGIHSLRPIAPFLHQGVIEKWIRAGIEQTS